LGFISFTAKLQKYLLQPRLLLLQNLLKRIPLQPFHLACFYLFLLDEIPALPLNPNRRLGEIRRGGPREVKELLRCENKPEIFCRRFEKGEQCLVVFMKEEIAGYGWLSYAPVYLEERYRYPVQIPPDTVYIYDSYIVPEHRRKGLWLQLIEQEIYFMKKIGRKKLLVMVDDGHERSIKLHRRAGFYPVKKIFYFRLFGKRFFKEKNIGKTEI
jgi:L-amino acid N-acyltransferase YncA